MEQDRLNFFKQFSNDAKKDLNASYFTISEIKEIINETALTSLERDIAHKKYVECKTYEEIANECCYDERTIKRRLPNISLKLKMTCVKLFTVV